MRMPQDDKGALGNVCKIKVRVHAEVITQEEVHLGSRTDLIYTSRRERVLMPLGFINSCFYSSDFYAPVSFWLPLCRDEHNSFFFFFFFACLSLLPLFLILPETVLELERSNGRILKWNEQNSLKHMPD